MAENLSFSCLFHTGPVTALHMLEDKWIIAGVGSYLYIYNTDKNVWQQRSHVLPCRCIHGIRQGRDKTNSLCVFGEKCCCVLHINHVENKTGQHHSQDGGVSEGKDTERNEQDSSPVIICDSSPTEMEDWIWDSHFLNKAANMDVVLALCHNVILRWDWKENIIKQRVCCVENCILYCAKFIGHSWENLILAAGTVFNQVLLWSPVGQKSSHNGVEVMHRLTGHEGVIFSIDFNLKRRIICSVSDDRSIIVWQLKFPASGCTVGDGNSDEMTLGDWLTCDSCVQCVLYGHSARVWDVKILTTGLVSVGEDSTCCIWDFSGKVLQKFKGHKGKSIWSLAVNANEDFVVTGGGDTSIRLWKLGQDQGNHGNKMTQLSLSLPKPQADPDNRDFPRSTSMISYRHLLIMTNEGILYLYDLDTGQWNVLMEDAEFRSYTIVALSPFGSCVVVALGNIAGKLKLLVCNNSDFTVLSNWTSQGWQLYSGKIFSINWLSHDLILTTGLDGVIDKWCFCVQGKTMKLVSCGKFLLPKCRQRWVSAACVLSHLRLLICGDRGGTIHVYDDVVSHKDSEGESLQPKQSFAQIHGKTGVTDICCHGDDVYTGGRDGFYRKFSKVDDGQLVLLNSYRVYKGFEWIDRLQLVTEEDDIFIYGFQSTDFVLWSVNNNQKLAQIPCGGGHRAWDCVIDGDHIRMTYLKTGEVVMAQTRLQRNQVLVKESLHGRVLTCAQYLSEGTNGGSIVVTGSDDTGIQLSNITYNTAGVMVIRKIHSLQGHISSVRAFTSCSSGLELPNVNKTLLFSGGGRAQILVWCLSFPKTFSNSDSVREISCESLCCYMLGQTKRRGRTRSWKLQKIKPNPETRFMDLCSVTASRIWKEAPKHLHILGSACSDGFVRMYIFDEVRRSLHLLKETFYHKHCVLKIKYLCWQNGASTHLIYITTATDGSIAFWDVTDIFQTFTQASKTDECDTVDSATSDDTESQTWSDIENPDSSLSKDNDQMQDTDVSHDKLLTTNEDDDSCDPFLPIFTLHHHHQSGVNSIHTLMLDNETFLVGSGGDDNAIRISQIRISTPDNKSIVIQQLITGVKEDAHAAQVTGVHFLSSSKLLSVSIDQRLCLWDFTLTDECVQLKQLNSKFIDVSDVAGMEIWEKNRNDYEVLIAGQGLSLWRLFGAYQKDKTS